MLKRDNEYWAFQILNHQNQTQVILKEEAKVAVGIIVGVNNAGVTIEADKAIHMMSVQTIQNVPTIPDRIVQGAESMGIVDGAADDRSMVTMVKTLEKTETLTFSRICSTLSIIALQSCLVSPIIINKKGHGSSQHRRIKD